MPVGDWIPDPRLEALGQRMLLPARDKATSPSGEPETEGVEFRAWRIEHGIAEGDSEITSGVHSYALQVYIDDDACWVPTCLPAMTVAYVAYHPIMTHSCCQAEA